MKMRSNSWLALGAATLIWAIPVSASGADDVAAAPISKEAQKAAEKQARAAAAAEKKRMAELRRQYGEGPYPFEIDAYLVAKPDALKPLYRTLFIGGERNAVLNFQRLGLAAMDLGLWDDAERAFDGALVRIEAIYAKNKQAEAARDTFRKEANKDFKGEPYERAMAYYYRGLLYLRKGDYDNARASFKTAEYQDTVSEAEEFKSDFAVMNYLVGWTYHCQGRPDMAKESFDHAAAAQAGLPAPAAGDRMLMVAELGAGPVKQRTGAQSEKLTFGSGPSYGATSARFALAGGTPMNTVQASSVYHQATTRGGRAIDAILNGKAEFKATTGAIGDAFTQTSMNSLMAGDTSTSNLGMAGVGMLFSMFASAAKTEADIRGWDTLPDQITLATAGPVKAEALAGARVDYLAGGETAKGVAPVMAASAGSCGILWSRARSGESVSAAVPGEDAKLAAQVAKRKHIQLRDKQFRSALAGS